jgi:hypothetical protein
MKTPSPLDSNIVYMAGLVRSGFEGAICVSRKTLEDESSRSVLSQSVRESWKPAAVGAYLGILASIWKRDSKLPRAVWGGFIGSALGLAGGTLWNSRTVTGGVVRGAVKSVNAARDKRWLDLNPINYG